MLEAQAALQRQAAERPAILRIEREHALLLFLVRCLVGVHRHLIGNAVLEVVLELGVVVVVLRERRVVVVEAEAEFRRVRPGHVRRGPLDDVRESGVPGPVGRVDR